MRLRSYLLLVCYLAPVPLWAQETPFVPKELIAQAKARAPEAQIASAEAKAAAARVSQAKAPPDPRVMVMPNFINLSDKSGEVELWVRQDVPLGGVLRLRGEQASYQAEAAKLDATEASLSAERDVAERLGRIASIDAELRVLVHHQEITGGIITAAEAAYTARRVMLSEVLSAKVARAEVEARVSALQGQRQAEVVALNVRLGFPPGQKLATAPTMTVTPVTATLESLLAKAAGARPALSAQASTLRGAEAAVRVAQAERLPMLTVGAALMPQFGGGVQLGGFVEMSVPLYLAKKQDQAVEEAKAMRDATALQSSLLEASVSSEIITAYTAMQAAISQLENLRTELEPLATQALDSALASYQSGQSPLSGVLQAEVDLYHLEIMEASLLSEAWTARQSLEAAVGAEVE